MFRTTMCPSSGETTVFMRHLVLVILCAWLSGIQEHMLLHTRWSSAQNNKYQVSHKHSCFCWWWAHSRPKHVEIGKYTTNNLCTKLALFTRVNTNIWQHHEYGKLLKTNIYLLIMNNVCKKLITSFILSNGTGMLHPRNCPIQISAKTWALQIFSCTIYKNAVTVSHCHTNDHSYNAFSSLHISLLTATSYPNHATNTAVLKQ